MLRMPVGCGAASNGARARSTSPGRPRRSARPVALRREGEKLMETLEPLLREHEFFRDLDPGYLALLAGCASNVRFGEGSFLFREGEPADRFFLIRQGRVAVEIAAPGRGAIIVQTVADGGVVGFSWLLEPHTWEFDARALTPVRAFALDGVCLRGKCEQDTRLGFNLMQRFAGVAVRRLQATRLQLLDVYGHAGAR
jgi:CRP/FNR family cyclic AMP-dependent transcriptional regulator